MTERFPKPNVEPAPLSGDARAAYEAVLDIAQHMHRGHHWAQGTDKQMRCVKAPLLKAHVAAHVDAGRPIGLCPIAPGTSTMRAACLDMDSHKGEVPWDEMTAQAERICVAARGESLEPIPFRSTGGSGIHLIFLWHEPQDAHSVRCLLTDIIQRCGFESGTKGVKHREIEVFPKQDSVPADGYGSMWVLPMSRKSVPLDADTFAEVALPHLPSSTSVPHRVKPPREPATAGALVEDFDSIKAAVEALPAVEYDYELWRDIVFAIHAGTEGSDAGLALAQWYNDNRHPHERGPEWLPSDVWPHIKEGGVTVATLFHHARKAGWGAPDAEGFEDCSGADNGHYTASAETEGFTSDPAAPVPEVPTYEDMTTIDLVPPEPRDWLIDGWLAAGVVHMLFAKGGMGKSLLAQQLATSVATTTHWLNLPVVKGGPVLGYFCEEDGNELRWRQKHIFERGEYESAKHGVDLHLQARLGMENVLVRFDNERKGKRTRFFNTVRAEVARLKPRLLILDNVAQLFSGVENDRSMVTQFTNAVASIAREHRCAVLLLGHTAKAEDSTYSGSTAWENVARVRWFLQLKADGTSDLSIEKSNVGPRARVAVNYDNHVFVPFDRATEATASAIACRDVVLEAIHVITTAGEESSDGRSLSMSRNQATYAPKAIVQRGLAPNFTVEVVEAALNALIGQGLVGTEVTVGRRPNRTARVGVGLTSEGIQALTDKLLKGQESDSLA